MGSSSSSESRAWARWKHPPQIRERLLLLWNSQPQKVLELNWEHSRRRQVEETASEWEDREDVPAGCCCVLRLNSCLRGIPLFSQSDLQAERGRRAIWRSFRGSTHSNFYELETCTISKRESVHFRKERQEQRDEAGSSSVLREEVGIPMSDYKATLEARSSNWKVLHQFSILN